MKRALLVLLLLLVPAWAQKPKNAVTFPDGSTKTYSTQDEAIDAFEAIISGRQNGTATLSFGGQSVTIKIQGDSVEFGSNRVTRAAMLANLDRSQAQGQFTACQVNLKNLGTCAEMYSTEHGGGYPEDLGKIVPTYAKALPRCPLHPAQNYAYETSGKGYQLRCPGGHPKVRAPAGYPRYDSLKGLIDRP